MSQTRSSFLTRLAFPVVLLMLVFALIPALAQPSENTVEGWFTVITGDPVPGSGGSVQMTYRLALDNGQSLQLEISPAVIAAAGGAYALDHQRVQITVSADKALTGGVQVRQVKPVSLPLVIPEGAGQRTVLGTQPWVTIMCAFPGTPVGQGTQNLSYFQTMYSASYPGIDHYWRQQSFEKVNLIGSAAYGWYTLPQPQSYYIPTPGSNSDANLDALQADCVAAADAEVNFAPFVGINMMFNGTLDCCAWGGGSYLTIDGSFKLWRLTWNPPWSWADVTVVSHEVGHGFGLPHANNYDGDNNPYDSPWDVMSDPYTFCALAIDPTYGCLGQHTNAAYKDRLGWFDPSRRLDVTVDTGAVTLDNETVFSSNNYQIINVPISGSSVFYVVEARQTTGSNYDVKLPGKAVIIWEVDTTRQEDAWQVGATSDAASQSVSSGPDGAWLPGETFTDAVHGISISVISSTTDGFVVSVDVPDPVVTSTPTETATPGDATATPTATPTDPGTVGTELLINGGFEAVDENSNPDLTPWTVKNATGDKIKCNTLDKTVAYSGECAYRFKGGIGENSKLIQSADLTGISFAPDDTLHLSLYGLGGNIATSGKVKVTIQYSDAADAGKITATIIPAADYSEITGGYLLESASVSKIKLQIINKSTAGKLYVDEVSLTHVLAGGGALLTLP